MSPASRVRAELRAKAVAGLRTYLAAHPPEGAERVVLFGSLARGDFDGASDADLLVIGGTGAVADGVHDAVGRECDILPWTAEAWHRGTENGNPFVATVMREGVELWRAPGAAAWEASCAA